MSKSKWTTILPSLLLLLVLLVPAMSIAASGFSDVPESNGFAADIDWLAAAGITKGCNPPVNDLFCPSANVTREQMAAFMHRLAVSQVVDAATVGGLTAAELTGQQGSPGGPGYVAGAYINTAFHGDGFPLEVEVELTDLAFVTVSAQASYGSDDSSALDIIGCGITSGNDYNYAQVGSWRYPTVSGYENPFPTCVTQALYALTPGTYTFRMSVIGTSATTYTDQGNILATVLPLGTNSAAATQSDPAALVEQNMSEVRPDRNLDSER